jgi:hypothetical protein
MSSARNLLAASDQLWQSVQADLQARSSVSSNTGSHADITESHGPGRPFLQHAAAYLMIAGFAVENGLKAILVQCQQAAATRVRRGELAVASELLTHDLRRLAADAGISMSAAEGELLDRLRAYLMWAGRYPVAATARGQAAVQNIWGNDQQAIAAFLAKVEAAFSGEPPSRGRTQFVGPRGRRTKS